MKFSQHLQALLGVITFISLTSCGKQETQQGGEPVENETTGKVTILCDESIYQLLKIPVELFDSTYRTAEVNLQPASARRAMAELLSGSAKGIVVARDYLKDEDSLMRVYGVQPHERYLIARDALVFFTHKNFQLDTLNREQLKSVLLTPENGFKKAFPVIAQEPVFSIAGENSSEYANLLTKVLGGSEPKHAFSMFQSIDSVKALVRSNQNVIGIGYLSHVALDTNFKLLKIGFYNDSTGRYVTPKIVHQSHIVMGNYPFEVPVYAFMLDKRIKQPAWGLFSFLARDPKVQVYFKDKGIVPAHARFNLVEE
ncbi:MAG TPA: substrate-binding domain-containing protein [Patescibacteria group bacterium]|nr:substrate-binding domain-containing protein [Patescibacteria group bacterium]